MFDKHFDFIPDARTWEKPFAALRAAKERSADTTTVQTCKYRPLLCMTSLKGRHALDSCSISTSASGGHLTWEDVRSKGMLNGVYGSAFNTFLKLAELDWPPSIDHPVVALFLLVCDIAINPSAGFPNAPSILQDVH